MTDRWDQGPGPHLLVLRALGLGDAVTAVPALRGLRRAFPEHELILAGPQAPGEWLHGLGLVDRVAPATGLRPLRLPDDLRTDERGLIAVNLHGRGPQSHRLLRGADPLQLIAFRHPEDGGTGPSWSSDEHEVDRWCRLVRSAGGACDREDLRLPLPPGRSRNPGSVVVHPGAASGSRRWPVERWVEVVRWLRGGGHDVVVTGGPAERDLCAGLARAAVGVRTVAGALTLTGLADLVAGAGLLLCGDTGVAHLATAYGTPSVLLFGPVAPQHWGPAIDGWKHHVLWHGPETGPGDPHGSVVDPALALITAEEVISAVERLPAQLAVTSD